MSGSTRIATAEPIAEGLLVHIRGEIDLSTSPALRAELLKIASGKDQRLIVNMTEVAYMDSSGVATLVEVLQRMNAKKGRMVLFGLQPKVKGVFEIAKLDMFFTIVADLEKAKTA